MLAGSYKDYVIVGGGANFPYETVKWRITWRSVGKVPFDAPCGEGLVLMGDTIHSINGETKPGVRTNAIYSGTIPSK
ncbi:hypothetical protein [Solibacillus sp. R5-41]|uniref:hypothetical protein n=1 Tax=Solibacillus sp. R5-41 TaxID=2048654 RepID=UPI001C12B37E|nr:hypothetical protein [Solibacillus sp. R5-41]